MRCLALLSLLLIGCSTTPCHAQRPSGGGVSEQTLKAAFLYKFLNYVEWPDDSLADVALPFTIGVLGARELADELAGITADRSIENRSIQVRQVRAEDALEQLHILFIGEQEDERLGSLIAPARSRPILTVTESDNALSAGSIINFVVEEDRVRFEVSLSEAEQSQLRLDSRLLAVAREVHRTLPGEAE
jgi:hypothetical protein